MVDSRWTEMIGSFLSSLFTVPLNFLYWIKWVIVYTTIRIYNACHSKRFDLYDVYAIGDPVKQGFVIPHLEKELESPFPETHLQEAADQVLFYGVNSKSECVLVRVARGANQVSDAWIYVQLANGKTYRLTQSVGHQQPFEGKCHNFSCGKLQMHYLVPMRKWRIFYSGMLKESSENKSDSEEMVFVKFVFLWKAASDVYDFTLDSNPVGFADSLAQTEWKMPFLPPIQNVVDAANFYGQSGVINGTVSVNDGDNYEMYLFGERWRSLGKRALIEGCHYINILGNTPGNGFTFHFGKASAQYVFNNLPYGFVVQPDAQLKVVEEVDITYREKSENTFQAVFTAGEKYEIRGEVIGDPIVFYCGQGWSGFAEVNFIEFTMGERKGNGFILSGLTGLKPRIPPQSVIETPFPRSVPLTVPFSDEVSHFGEISGGKTHETKQ